MFCRLISKIICSGVFILLFVKLTEGCMYGPPYATVCEKYARADAIVIASITRVKSGGNGQLVKLDIQHTYKGRLNEGIELDQPLSTCDWDFSDEVGKRLLLYLAKNKGKKTYHAIGTGYGGPIEREQADIYWLKALPESVNRTRLSGAIRLYNDEPFDYIRGVANISLLISDGKNKVTAISDEHGVYEVWDIPAGKYRITPSFAEDYKLRFPMALGDAVFTETSDVKVDTYDFEIVIGKEKCGGGDFVLNKVNE